MSAPISNCPCCKHFIGAKDRSEPLTCKAFPKEIPFDYLFGKVDVKSIKECNNGIGYEE